MPTEIKCPEQFVFGLDIGTRSIVGTIGYMDSRGFHVIAMEVKEHESRAMMDGQVHDISVVSEEINAVKATLEKKIGRPLTNVCIAAAGRVLRTITVSNEMTFDEEKRINSEDIYNLDFSGVEMAHRQINEANEGIDFYCVGYTPVKYYINGYEIGNPDGHKAYKIGVDLLATFLPEEVVDGLYASVEAAGLEVANLTLEPIAAMNVAIPPQYRLLNIALVDVGAGTSDICITRDGSVVAYGMIPYAGDEISEVVAKQYLVDFAQAEMIKLAASNPKKTIMFKDIMGTKVTITKDELLKVTQPVTDKITQSVADKIIELNGGKAVSAVFVVGGGGKIPGFTLSLADRLGLPKERVAIRGKEVLGDVEFAIDNFKKDSLFVTPVGICINYYNQKNNFIYVTVNGDRIKLYDNSKLTVIDAIMQAGYPNEKLFPRRGESINYTLNGQARMIRGEAGEPAKLYKNGKEASMNTEIVKNDFIDIEESTSGPQGVMTIGELPEYKSTVSFNINDKNITCPKFAYVNGSLEAASYVIKAGDHITMENYYTVEQLFTFMDIDITKVDVFVNNELAYYDTKIYENFTVRYEEIDKPREVTVEEIIEERAVAMSSIKITVNETMVILSGKEEYKFVDIFDVYPFDLTTMGGDELVKKINGALADFSDSISEGDQLELYWSKE